MSTPWRDGNRFAILENGASYFPRVYTAIGKAREEILIETFILFDDAVGRELREALMAAARRGVRIDVTVDGYGSDGLPPDFIAGLVELGVGFHVFDPRPRLLGMRTNLFRRLHRKIVAIDGTLAYVGGLNFSADHLDDYGPQSKQDYAIEIAGPLAADIRDFARAALAAVPRRRWRRARPAAPPQAAGPARARLVVRDNDQHTNDIEQSYRVAIRAARRDIVIANAYFFPGYRLLRDLRAAAARGVRVRLILQGEPDMPIAQLGARLLYDALAEAGVEILEYCERPLHGKVASIDDEWATVGSSNLDPFSLALNLEANVEVRDSAFASGLRERLERLAIDHCRPAPQSDGAGRQLRRLFAGALVYHFLRRFPAWAGSLPAHKPRIQTLRPDGQGQPDEAT